MTGTAREVTRELAHVYELAVVAVPPARPVRRIHGGEWIARSAEQKRRMLIERVRSIGASGQPLLIGTQTVEDSLVVSAWLREHEIEHRLLNATAHREEAEIIGCAGELGAITVATNMAGRGTDIRLAEGVAGRGGLFVLSTGRGESARVDRQLAGRAGRRGDPGRFEAILSLEDTLVREFFHPFVLQIARSDLLDRLGLCSKVGRSLNSYAQAAVERRHAAERRAVLREEEMREKRFAFAGGTE
jgi:preprotein translocase subunit SecA